MLRIFTPERCGDALVVFIFGDIPFPGRQLRLFFFALDSWILRPDSRYPGHLSPFPMTNFKVEAGWILQLVAFFMPSRG